MGAFVPLSFVPSPVVIVNAKSLTLDAFPHAAEKNINNRRHFKKLFLAKAFAFCKVQLSNTGSRTGGVSPWSPRLEDLDKFDQNRSSVIPLPAFPRHLESQHRRPPLPQRPSSAPSLYSHGPPRVLELFANDRSHSIQDWRKVPQESHRTRVEKPDKET